MGLKEGGNKDMRVHPGDPLVFQGDAGSGICLVGLRGRVQRAATAAAVARRVGGCQIRRRSLRSPSQRLEEKRIGMVFGKTAKSMVSRTGIRFRSSAGPGRDARGGRDRCAPRVPQACAVAVAVCMLTLFRLLRDSPTLSVLSTANRARERDEEDRESVRSKTHPDVNSAPDAAEKFARVSAAYDILSDPKERSKYERLGGGGFAGFGGGGATSSPSARRAARDGGAAPPPPPFYRANDYDDAGGDSFGIKAPARETCRVFSPFFFTLTNERMTASLCRRGTDEACASS